MTATDVIAKNRDQLDRVVSELATTTQGAAWVKAVVFIYDGREELIGRHVTYVSASHLPSPPSQSQPSNTHATAV